MNAPSTTTFAPDWMRADYADVVANAFTDPETLSVGALAAMDPQRNALHIASAGEITDGGQDYGLTITTNEPGIAFVDRAGVAGQSLIRGLGAQVDIAHDAVNSDGTIGAATNLDTVQSASFGVASQRFYVDGVERLRLDQNGLLLFGSQVLRQNDVSADPDLSVDPGKLPTRAAVVAKLPGTRALIEAVDLAGLVSHDFIQFDPTRFIGYEMECVAMDIGASGGADLSLRTSADGITFDDTPGDYTITRLANGDPADNASGSSTTSAEVLLHSGLSYSAGDTSNARLTIMRPDLLAPTMIRGKWWVERANSFEYIDLYAQRTAALPVTALRFSRRFPPNTFTAGFVYLFGIRG